MGSERYFKGELVGWVGWVKKIGVFGVVHHMRIGIDCEKVR
jgi:hypothetical protein